MQFTEPDSIMGQKKIGDYLDSGSLGLFVQQIVDFLEGTTVVTIHDTDGRLVWADSGEGENERDTVEPFVRERIPGPGFSQRLDDQRLAYVFYLDCSESDDLIGTMCVLVESSKPISFEFAYHELQPILSCIERQVAERTLGRFR